MGNPVDLRVVSDVAEIVANVATFNSNAADHVETAKKMLTQTSNWVFVADKRLFGPSKFCGFFAMDFLRYARAQQELRSNFDGGRTRRGIEKTIGLAYEADDGLATQLVSWGEALLGSDIFARVNHAKWRFITANVGRNMPAVSCVDDVMWLNHIADGNELAKTLRELRPGQRISLSVGGHAGIWERMADGTDGTPTLGIKPADPDTRRHWRSIQRGSKVGIEPAASEDSPQVAEEREHRLGQWEELKTLGGPSGVNPTLLHQLGIYGGTQGIWVDKVRTGGLTLGESGVTVGLLHTGEHNDDDLTEDNVLYHYPTTNRPPSRDRSEVAATKAACTLSLPVFFITRSEANKAKRDVRLGWVQTWDDGSRVFLVTLGGQRPETSPSPTDEDEFSLTDKAASARRTERAERKGQTEFKIQVLKRYGPECATCGLDVIESLDAAHIRSRKQKGSNDARNGLILCATHHRAYDAGLFAIEPGTLDLRFRRWGPDAAALRITKASIADLRKAPHPEALAWAWDRWKGEQDSGQG